MAVTNQELFNIFLANPNMSDAQIVSLMETRGISPEQISSTFSIPVGEVISRMAPVLTENVAQYGTQIQTPTRDETGSTEVSLRNLPGGFNAYQDESGQLSFSRVSPDRPGMIQLYGPNGEYRGEEKITTTTQDLIKYIGPIALAAGGSALAQGLFGGSAAGNGAFLGEGVVSGVPAFDAALANATVGATGLTAAQIAALTAQDLAIGGGALAGTAPLTAPQIAAAGGATTGLLTPAATTAASTLTPAATAATALIPAAVSAVAPTAISALTPAAIAQSLIPTAVNKLLTPTNIGNVVQTGTQTAAGLLQQQTSREAAQKAQAMIDAETAAAKTSAAFRPIGMTTRFGTSQFAIDPKTGQLTSAGYTLSPEAKAKQDRFMALSNAGLTQAEQAQAQFAPLQTGATNLFTLGNKYLAQTPEDVARNYLAQQMSLLQPGRELEFANLQTKLRNQGRLGLSVAQGGDLGATTPELQALYNARARQEAELAANAQLAGQRDVLFGSSLLGQGAQTMGQYYAGQQAAYAPYTTAMGQVQGLEALGQQPFTLGSQLGQTASTAGARSGQLGLEGARLSTALATSADATRNPYASALSGAAANPMFNQVIGGLFGSQPATSGFSYGKYGTGIDPSTGEYFGSLYF